MSVIDALGKELGGRVNMPSFEFIANHHKAKCFIDHSVRLIEEHLEKEKIAGKRSGRGDLVVSWFAKTTCD